MVYSPRAVLFVMATSNMQANSPLQSAVRVLLVGKSNSGMKSLFVYVSVFQLLRYQNTDSFCQRRPERKDVLIDDAPCCRRQVSHGSYYYYHVLNGPGQYRGDFSVPFFGSLGASQPK